MSSFTQQFFYKINLYITFTNHFCAEGQFPFKIWQMGKMSFSFKHTIHMISEKNNMRNVSMIPLLDLMLLRDTTQKLWKWFYPNLYLIWVLWIISIVNGWGKLELENRKKKSSFFHLYNVKGHNSRTVNVKPPKFKLDLCFFSNKHCVQVS